MKALTSTGLRVNDQGIWILDQTLLPKQEKWILSSSVVDMVEIIRALKVRGAPLIGVAASLQLGILVEQGLEQADFERALFALREARPTAVNLMNCLDRLLFISREEGLAAVPGEAVRIFEEDVELCARMAKNGGSLIQAGERVLTHCNTGGLATAGVGTALGCVLWAHGIGRSVHVLVDETRPLLQGARLTTWELARAGVPHTLICDGMAAFKMQSGEVSRVLVGADRIARNGDFANKVGTYGLAVLCKYHGIPFHVVAPQTTVDPTCVSGREIPIEERAASEVRSTWAPESVPVWNPAFDVTPFELVTSWVMDRGVFSPEDVQRGALVDF